MNMSFKMEGDKIDPAGCVVKRSGHLDKQKGKLGKFLKKKVFYLKIVRVLGMCL